jgi:alcohol dehydrogenase (cytochrome c)
VGASGSRSASDVSIPAFSAADLAKPAGNDWISDNGNIQGWRYSSLSQINGSNGNSLKLVWSAHLAPPATPERVAAANGHPIEYQGVLYQEDAWTRVTAIDATSGKILWQFDPQVGLNVPGNGTDMRGVGIGDGKVYYAIYGTVYALDAKTGAQVWANQIVDPNSGGGTDIAPVYYKGMVILGTTGGDWGGACIVIALDAKTGKTKWFYNTIPSNPRQPGWNTWPSHRSYFGGGAVWDPISIDPKLDLVYAGVSNPVPYAGSLNGPGKELNTESVLALHAATGKFAWVYQEVHHDIWDYDAMQTPVVGFIKQNGKQVDVVDSLNKNAYNFILYADSGKPVVGIPEVPVPQNAAQHTYPTQPIPKGDDLIPHVPSDPDAWQGLAPDGKPFEISKQPYTPYDETHYVVVAPTYTGGTDWYESGFSPRTGYFYACVNVTSFAYEAFPPADIHPVIGNVGSFAANKTATSPTSTRIGRLVAVDMTTNKMVWKTDTPNSFCTSPVLMTGGGLVIIGRNEGTINAYDDKTGNLMWSIPNIVSGQQTPVNPRITTYAVNGKQYIVAFTNSTVLGPELDAYALP